ncbi:MAG: DNA recombination protein RmuC [Candidatus Phaeomarinobacter sp.]
MDMLLIIAAAVAAALASGLIVAFVLRRPVDNSAQENVLKAAEAQEKALASLMDAQSQLSGRLAAMSDAQAKREAELSRTLNERLDNVSKRLGDGLEDNTKKTGETLSQLHTRLALIDEAQKKLGELSGQMVGLQDILANKQARGAFGEIQLQDLVTAALPPSAYAFQETLSNKARADCIIKMPNPPGSIAVDSKFPLESYRALVDAKTDDETAKAKRFFRDSMLKHVNDIAAKYIIPGETADSALMFLPSEAVYAELHANFPATVDASFKAKVWIVSPTTLMATLNTVRAVLKDAQMREQAHLIQAEVERMLTDVTRLDDRVSKLSRHFGQAQEDIRQIGVSTDKITKRGERIADVDIGEDETGQLVPPEWQRDLLAGE